MTAGLGMTKSSPFGLFVTTPHSRAGDLGLPGRPFLARRVVYFNNFSRISDKYRHQKKL